MAKDGKQSKADCKVVVLGAGGVGKSALTIRLVTGNFAEDYDPTIEDSYRKHCSIDDKPCLLEVLDTAGQEEFSSMQDQWILEGNGYLLVYSITSVSSFEKCGTLRNKILRIIENIEESKIPIVIAGNKCDLENERQVNKDNAMSKAQEWGVSLFETSAKSMINNTECFYQIVRKFRQINEENDLNNQNNRPKNATCCKLL